MNTSPRALVRAGHLVWIVSLVNAGLGFFIPGFDPFSQSISEVALESSGFAYTHRGADIVIGLSMCAFGLGAYMAAKRRLAFTLVAVCLLGASFISAGIWTLESPLHLLYNLSIFMIVVPLAFALELKASVRWFDTFCLAVAFVHVFMFWLIYAGFMPQEVSGLIQRIWNLVLVSWFGAAAHIVCAREEPANNLLLATPEDARA